MAGTQCYGIVKNLSFKLIGNYVVMFSYRGNQSFWRVIPYYCTYFVFCNRKKKTFKKMYDTTF